MMVTRIATNPVAIPSIKVAIKKLMHLFLN